MNPHENKFNIYERKTTQQVPKTRDRFTHNPLAKLLNPDIQKKTTENKERFRHDKLDVSDIEGTNVDVYRKYKKLEGRDYLGVDDIDKTRPNQLKQNRITNIPDYRIDCTDIDSPKKNKFVTGRSVDPLNPVYKMET